MEQKKESLCTINTLMIIVIILIVATLIFGFCYFENGLASDVLMALFFIVFLWLNIIFIVLKLEQISLRNRMIDPILMRRLSNIMVIIAIAILLIIIMLISRVLFMVYFI
ncbi:MAG: hypothetical protein PHT62_13460 [Desulfotomaculaceae bacterium]|nr:hypothetical protein [Desulfotomaculaceae bacterium]